MSPEEAGAGRRYLECLRDRNRSSPDEQLIQTVWWGEGLTDAQHLTLVLAALESATSDDDLWAIGDGPVEEGLLPRRTAGQALLDARDSDPKLHRLWHVMREYYGAMGLEPGAFWSR